MFPPKGPKKQMTKTKTVMLQSHFVKELYKDRIEAEEDEDEEEIERLKNNIL